MMPSLLSLLRRFYSQAYLAITDFDFYTGVCRQSLPRTFLFFSVLALHVAVIGLIQSAWILFPATSRLADWVERTFPVIQLTGGRMSVEGELPLVIESPEKPAAAVVFVGEGQQAPRLDGPSVLVLTPDEAYFQGQEPGWMNWSWLPDQRIAPLDLADAIRLARWLFLPLFFAFLLLLFLIPRAAEAVIFSLFGYSANARVQRRWPFARYYTIAIYGLTPAIVVEQLGRLLGVTGIGLHLIYLTTAGIYVYIGTSKALLAEKSSSTK